MTLDEVIARERVLERKFHVRADHAVSDHIKQERRKEAKYHGDLVLLLIELKERRTCYG